MAATIPDSGIVTNHAITIERATPQFTALIRLEAPTPNKEPLTTCVVLTGKCKNVAVKIVIAEFKSAAKPLMVSNLKDFCPHGGNNFPTTNSRTTSHRSRTAQLNPQWNI